jgi:hypothetical protein
VRKSSDPQREDEEAEGVIRGWLRMADGFLRRPQAGSVTGKTGGDEAGTDEHDVKSRSKR